MFFLVLLFGVNLKIQKLRKRVCVFVIYKLNVKRMSMKKLTFLFLCLVLGIGLATAQTREITGSVISAEDDQPVIGASVVVKGTTTGTVTL